jgi:hypothetical protein
MAYEENKVFDVSKPGQATADATSRPIIVGHRPTMNDPMMKGDGVPETSTVPTPIQVAMADEEPQHIAPHSAEPASSFMPNENSVPTPQPEEVHLTSAEQPQSPEPVLEENSQDSNPGSNFTSLGSLIGPDDEKSADNDHHQPQNHDGGFSKPPEDNNAWQDAPPFGKTQGAGPRHKWPKIFGWIFGTLFIIVAVFYLAIDLGIVQSDMKLPFHIFNKQKASTVVTSTPPPAPAKVQPSPPPAATVPTGFTEYKLAGTNLSFAYPTVWGAPTDTPDPGFSKRGGTNKTDGTYAHVVNFATNKDVQLAFTSSKYLPAARGALYYDFLNWCVGTNDQKIYTQILHFATTSGIDTPSTITCDQGPLADAVKQDDNTILQAKTKDTAGKDLGDIYTQNLSDKDLPVARIKDATSASADNIKKLLATIKVSSASSATPPSTP